MMPSQGGTLVGHVKAIYRYPIKSMRGESLSAGRLGLRGFSGDRRFAFIQMENLSGFPWLTARQYPALVTYAPYFTQADAPHNSPARVRTPDGQDLPVESPELRERIAYASQRRIHLLRLDFNRTFDVAEISIITSGTLEALSRLTRREMDARRFRPNIVIETPVGDIAWPEDTWEGKRLVFGEDDNAPRVRVVFKDPRCKMVDIDPDTGVLQSGTLDAIVRSHKLSAGVYGAIEQSGAVVIGAPVWLVTP